MSGIDSASRELGNLRVLVYNTVPVVIMEVMRAHRDRKERLEVKHARRETWGYWRVQGRSGNQGNRGRRRRVRVQFPSKTAPPTPWPPDSEAHPTSCADQIPILQILLLLMMTVGRRRRPTAAPPARAGSRSESSPWPPL
jgi:hypothetical protein